MELIGSPETSDSNQLTPQNNPEHEKIQKMAGYCSTGQSLQRAVVLMEKEDGRIQINRGGNLRSQISCYDHLLLTCRHREGLKREAGV